MKKFAMAVTLSAALITAQTLGLVATAQAGSWICAEGCDPATLKGIKWVPGAKCTAPVAPEINVKSPKAYNDAAAATNNFINSGNGYFTCMNDELNGDFGAAQQSMNETAKLFFDKAQADFKVTVDKLSAQLDESLKKLNKK
jgi:hypothetical protein